MQHDYFMQFTSSKWAMDTYCINAGIYFQLALLTFSNTIHGYVLHVINLTNSNRYQYQ